MNHFATLLHQLSFAHARNRKLVLMSDYFRHTPDPARGLALAALTGSLSFATVKSSSLRALVEERVDPVLFGLSYDYVGDLAETVSLIWPVSHQGTLPDLPDMVEALTHVERHQVIPLITPWLDAASEIERYAIIKLISGNLRVGVSERLAKQALADAFESVTIEDIEEVWHGLEPPYLDLFSWLEGKGPRPEPGTRLTFRPLMLSHALEEADHALITPENFAAEWKWDGIRVQLAGNGEQMALFSRGGEDISHAFPDMLAGLRLNGVWDGELLVMKDGHIRPFNDLQQRLNRKSPTKKMLDDYPVHVRLYDMLMLEGEDLRALPLTERRLRLEQWVAANPLPRFDLSPVIAYVSLDELASIQRRLRTHPDYVATEGFMLKRRDAPYLSGRPKGYWYKWKRDPLTADVVLMYAQRGHGKRSSYYSDYTFGAWDVNESGERTLVPVGKAYSGYTDKELLELDKWIRNHTIDRFGPVRSVSAGIVFEVGFDSIHPSLRHKSGVAMRFPRILHIRWDKPVEEADTVETLKKMAEGAFTPAE